MSVLCQLFNFSTTIFKRSWQDRLELVLPEGVVAKKTGTVFAPLPPDGDDPGSWDMTHIKDPEAVNAINDALKLMVNPEASEQARRKGLRSARAYWTNQQPMVVATTEEQLKEATGNARLVPIKVLFDLKSAPV